MKKQILPALFGTILTAASLMSRECAAQELSWEPVPATTYDAYSDYAQSAEYPGYATDDYVMEDYTAYDSPGYDDPAVASPETSAPNPFLFPRLETDSEQAWENHQCCMAYVESLKAECERTRVLSYALCKVKTVGTLDLGFLTSPYLCEATETSYGDQFNLARAECIAALAPEEAECDAMIDGFDLV